jgi:ABC-2 type transport system ATP-binding protein
MITEPEGASTANGQAALLLENASLDFGGGAGVFDLSLALERGSILGLIGPSGCGKTTTIRLLTGLYGPTSGQVRVFGTRPTAFGPDDRSRIGYIPQQFILYPNLSAEENLHFLGGMYGMASRDRRRQIARLLDFVELTDARRRLGRQLSGGMQRRLMLAGALLHDPELLFADEPTAGIDPILRARIWDNFRALRDDGRTLLVTTQYVGEAAYCDRVAVMRRGRLVAIDTPTGLRRRALGGDVLHVQVDAVRALEVRAFLESLPDVTSTQSAPHDPGAILVLVADAAAGLPTILAALRERLGVTPTAAEPYVPPFDEVFVRLLQQSEEA